MIKAADNKSSYMKDLWIGSILGGCLYNTQEDLNTIHGLRVSGRPRKETLIKSCFWELPSMGEVKINTDGESKGNLGKGGVGYIIKNCEGAVLWAGAKGLGTTTSFLAKCQVIIQGVKGPASNGWLVAWVEADSVAAVKAFQSGVIPWSLQGE
ncbi:hypothetical protein GIB67_019844 [Kingdonia uniflora]|uniref:RNase H type-1 domain-containing protein n=1 Tax=Kingdonia uniflora TaxID=39325 RepID=A0A7J7MKQ2_9MAGN|nr:hypothetical protein GIB67_019844 [Kingdonia uniflora]